MAVFEILAFFIVPVLRLIEPYAQQAAQLLYSRTLRRRIIQTFVSTVVLALLIGTSFSAYLGFYWLYIPQRGHVGQVHLQYGRPSVPGEIRAGPVATVDFSNGGKYRNILRGEQAYDVSVDLRVPTSESNVALGNFMVTVSLLKENGETLVTSSRPAILTYESLPVRLLRTAWKSIPLVLLWSKEEQVLKVSILENYIENPSNPIARAFVQVSNANLQIYGSTIHIDAHFHGLRYLMYYYKTSTAAVFMAIFIFWEVIFSIVTWQVLTSFFNPYNTPAPVQSEGDHAQQRHQLGLHVTEPQPTGQALPLPRQPQLRSKQPPQFGQLIDTDSEMDDSDDRAVIHVIRQPPLKGADDDSSDDNDNRAEHELEPDTGVLGDASSEDEDDDAVVPTLSGTSVQDTPSQLGARHTTEIAP
ncbi:Berardinelli-Seip congenital lipodystrophy 2 (seipin) [Lunasporangiospora selenospora]|uniref:Berardinelli-Seip congenital lipodystrophy 2 (Seipin) n=1 Tax=Lunasporangiospora selenospora TaxID=979761 RepID=A0A9P6KHB0_9FUNG|nr:Berardinelli-Seip congenital lipodystrophy 2 (seipin) [Lunasporangiospora selenospora]